MDSETTWLSADWGTTNFRLRLVEKTSLRVLAEITSPEGVAILFQNWKTETAAGNPSPEDRINFYKNFLLARIRELEKISQTRLENNLVVLSGMAGSTIGMTTLPYSQMPCPADGSGLHLLQHSPTAAFPYSLALVSGLCSADDVMRGEETMLIGAVAQAGEKAGSGWYIFPGTHSKHIYVAANQVLQLRTYMTGELFALLSEKSILAGSVEKSDADEQQGAFAAGLEEGCSGRLAHSLFLVRTADLLGKTNKPANFQFLSGLLIGHEIRDLQPEGRLCLVGSGSLLTAYQQAIQQLLPGTEQEIVDGASALIRGQWQIAGKIPETGK